MGDKRKTFRGNKQRRQRVLDQQRGVCQYCGDPDAHTIDHIVPLKKGGTNDDWNLQVLCDFCNNLKGDRWPFLAPPAEEIRKMKEARAKARKRARRVYSTPRRR